MTPMSAGSTSEKAVQTTISTAGSSSRMRAAAQAPSGPGGMRMSMNITANGSLAAKASRTAATAACAPAQSTSAKVVPGAASCFTGCADALVVNSRSRRLRNTAVSPLMPASSNIGPVSVPHVRLVVDDENPDWFAFIV